MRARLPRAYSYLTMSEEGILMTANSIQLGAEQLRKLREMAQRQGASEADVVNRAIDRLYEEAQPRHGGNGVRSLYDALVERGSIGVFDGPGDLTTNPKHMEGFGESAA